MELKARTPTAMAMGLALLPNDTDVIRWVLTIITGVYGMGAVMAGVHGFWMPIAHYTGVGN